MPESNAKNGGFKKKNGNLIPNSRTEMERDFCPVQPLQNPTLYNCCVFVSSKLGQYNNSKIE